jgi:hypothetical protein
VCRFNAITSTFNATLAGGLLPWPAPRPENQ